MIVYLFILPLILYVPMKALQCNRIFKEDKTWLRHVALMLNQLSHYVNYYKAFLFHTFGLTVKLCLLIDVSTL